MTTRKPTPPNWIVVQLGADLNWWLAEASADGYWSENSCGLLDPRQVASLVDILDEYEFHSCRRELLNGAFQLFQVESELADDRLRLAPVNDDISGSREHLFALPVIGEEATGPYYDFLDAITAARIRKLNAMHHYARACTDLEMQEELDALDRDRYIASEDIHCFDEINEILQWSPAEWDESSSV